MADVTRDAITALAAVAAGGNIVFTLTVKNNGPDSATNVTLFNELSNGAPLISSVPAATSQIGTTATYALGNLASDASITVVLQVLAPASFANFTSSTSVRGKTRA